MTRPSPLFHVDGEPGYRGGERQLLYLASALRARGRRNVIYCRAGAELEAEARRQNFEVRYLPFHCDWDPVSAWRLAADAHREGALIHAHTSRAAGIAALAGLGAISFVIHRRVDFPVGLLARRFKYARCAKIVAVSEAIANLLKNAGLDSQKIAVIPDGIPIDAKENAWVQGGPNFFRPPTPAEKMESRRALSAELGIDPSAAWVGNLAALVPHKDHDTLLQAAKTVLANRPKTRFLIAGTGPEQSRLKERINRLGLLGKVLMIGQRRDAVQLLQSMDVYVQSSWGEGMGSVLIEAAACGVPIVATTAGGIPEVVVQGQTGLLVPPRAPEALADAILRLGEEPPLARRLAEEGLRRLPRFGLARMAANMEKIYDCLA